MVPFIFSCDGDKKNNSGPLSDADWQTAMHKFDVSDSRNFTTQINMKSSQSIGKTSEEVEVQIDLTINGFNKVNKMLTKSQSASDTKIKYSKKIDDFVWTIEKDDTEYKATLPYNYSAGDEGEMYISSFSSMINLKQYFDYNEKEECYVCYGLTPSGSGIQATVSKFYFDSKTKLLSKAYLEAGIKTQGHIMYSSMEYKFSNYDNTKVEFPFTDNQVKFDSNYITEVSKDPNENKLVSPIHYFSNQSRVYKCNLDGFFKDISEISILDTDGNKAKGKINEAYIYLNGKRLKEDYDYHVDPTKASVLVKNVTLKAGDKFNILFEIIDSSPYYGDCHLEIK